MIERCRYLPCALHPALAVPTWAKIKNGDLYDGSPYSIAGPRFFIDLAHPAGWDHAVRAYVAISGVTVPESACCRFAWIDAADGWSVEIEYGEDVPGRMVHLTKPNSWSTPAGRREALCRAICAALNLDPNDVFPVSAS